MKFFTLPLTPHFSSDYVHRPVESEESELQDEPNTGCTSTIGGPEIKASKPMAIINSQRRHIHQQPSVLTNERNKFQDHNLAVRKNHRLSSNNESSSDPNSLNDSSSVEVLSEIDDEARFENSLSSFNHFES